MTTLFKNTDAPLLIVLGQSNAHGHGTLLSETEKILDPLPNVKGLSCSQNQSLNKTDITWSPFVTHGMNLGETQDHTCCLISEFARKWQAAIDEGATLPDLHVIQISIGGQGIDGAEKNGQTMWYPNRSPILQPGPLGQVDISLYPFTMQILTLARENLSRSGKTPLVLGIHWNQWETEVESGGAVLERAKDHYTRLIQDLFAIWNPCPFYFYKPLSKVYENETGRFYMEHLLDDLAQTWSHVLVIDIRCSPLWDEEREDCGIFQEDLVHYSNSAQKWFANWQYHQIF